MGLKIFPMVICIKDTIKTVNPTAPGSIIGQIILLIKDNFRMELDKDRVHG
jgi:hypothetical protein